MLADDDRTIGGVASSPPNGARCAASRGKSWTPRLDMWLPKRLTYCTTTQGTDGTAMSKTTPLFLSVTPGDPRSMTRQITDGIRMAIASGELPVGAQLPSVR